MNKTLENWVVIINISDLFQEFKLYYSKQCDYLLQREYGIENIWLSQKRIKLIWLNYHFLKDTQHTRYGSILSLLRYIYKTHTSHSMLKYFLALWGIQGYLVDKYFIMVATSIVSYEINYLIWELEIQSCGKICTCRIGSLNVSTTCDSKRISKCNHRSRTTQRTERIAWRKLLSLRSTAKWFVINKRTLFISGLSHQEDLKTWWG